RRGLDPVGAAIGQAEALMDQARWTPAEGLVKERLNTHRNDARLLSTLGTIMEKSGRPGDAQDFYQQALNARPRLTIARVNLAQLLFRLGKRDEGLRQLRRACDLDPGNAIAHLQLGRVLVQLDRLGEAESLLRRALELDDTRLETRLTLADVL